MKVEPDRPPCNSRAVNCAADLLITFKYLSSLEWLELVVAGSGAEDRSPQLVGYWFSDGSSSL